MAGKYKKRDQFEKEVFSLFVLFRLHRLCRGLEEGTNTCAPKMDDLSTPFEPETAPG